MREIKFRAWHKTEKKYIYDFNYNGYEILDEEGKIYISKQLDGSGESDCLVLEQYTGLKDKNGNECFKNDIFKKISNGDTYLIIWKGTGFYARKIYDSWLNQNIYSRESDTDLDFWKLCEIEIIGNINKDKELLNEK